MSCRWSRLLLLKRRRLKWLRLWRRLRRMRLLLRTSRSMKTCGVHDVRITMAVVSGLRASRVRLVRAIATGHGIAGLWRWMLLRLRV